MAPLRSFDAFAKPIDGIRERTISGGLITLIASVTAAILFLSELLVYLQVQTRHSMHLAESVPSALFDQSPSALLLSGHKIPLRVHVTFPHLPCNSLDYAHDGNSHSEGKFQHYHRAPFEFKKRIPTIEEYKTALSPSLPPNPKTDRQQGCTLIGTIQIPRVGGSLSVTVSPTAWRRATSLLSFGVDLLDGPPQPDPFHGKLPNVTHHIHSLTFGPPFPPGIDPLRNAQHVMDNGSGVALANVAVKLVPTTYVSQNPFSSEVETYQASVARHIVQPETLAAQRSTLLPGLMVTYDFTPLAVRHRERREDFLVFLSSLMGIVGGVFVTVGMVTGCLVNSAQAVAKKMD